MPSFPSLLLIQFSTFFLHNPPDIDAPLWEGPSLFIVHRVTAVWSSPRSKHFCSQPPRIASGVVQIPVVFHSPQLFFAEIRTKYCLQRTECLSFIYRRSERMRVLFDTLSVLCDKEFDDFGSKLSVLPDLYELRCQWDVSVMSMCLLCSMVLSFRRFFLWLYLYKYIDLDL